MSAPTSGTYAAWVSWLEAFRHGENPPTDRLGPIEGALGSYLEARLLEKLSVAFAERVRQWQTALGDRIVAAPPTGSADAAVLLREAVTRLDPLARLAGSPLLPRALGASMHAVLGEVRDGARAALDEAWRRHRDEEAPVRETEIAARRVVPAAGRPAAFTPVLPRPRSAVGGDGARRGGPAARPTVESVVGRALIPPRA